MKRYLAAATSAVALTLLTGCAATSTDTAGAAEQPAAATTPVPKPADNEAQPSAQATTQPDRPAAATCEQPSTALLDKIGAVLEGGATVAKAAAVRSADFSKAWMVAAQLDVPGVKSPQVAIFTTNGLDGDGLLMSIGGTAHQFSAVGHAENTAMAASMTSDGVDAAKGCLK